MKINRILYFLIPAVGTFLIAQDDLMIGNISGLTANPSFYLVTLAFYILMASCFASTIKRVTNTKIALLSFIGIVLSIIVSYSFTNQIQAFIHIICAYSGFAIFTLVLFKTIHELGYQDYALSQKLRYFFLGILLVILLLYVSYSLINGLMEIIYLFGIDIVLGIIEEKAN